MMLLLFGETTARERKGSARVFRDNRFRHNGVLPEILRKGCVMVASGHARTKMSKIISFACFICSILSSNSTGFPR